ncbi:MAG: DUF4920 domain-containing protein [Myxococcota bacterium]
MIRWTLLLSIAACSSQAAPSPGPESQEATEAAPAEAAPAETAQAQEAQNQEATPTQVAGPRAFGEPLSESAPTPLAEITGDPQRFSGQTVKTEGEITQVCQRMGCWMEMRSENGPAVRVPMAGHSFFLPRDVAGRVATIEGTVAVRTLSPSERAHLESEGAQATGQALQIMASGVVVR